MLSTRSVRRAFSRVTVPLYRQQEEGGGEWGSTLVGRKSRSDFVPIVTAVALWYLLFAFLI